MREEAVLFGEGRLAGIVTDPVVEPAGERPAVVLVNAGRLHRIGPNRLYVRIARELAERGHTVLRFDLSGIGESEARTDGVAHLDATIEETRAAMSFLSEWRGSNRFVVLGLCSGATLAVRTALADPRVAAVVAVNLPFGAAGSLAAVRAYVRKTRRYWWRVALARPGHAIRMALTLVRRPPSATRDPGTKVSRAKRVDAFRTLADRGCDVLLLYSEADIGLDYLHVVLGPELGRLRTTGRVAHEVVRGADHVFTPLATQDDLLHALHAWLDRVDGAGRRQATGSPLVPAAKRD